MDGINELLTRGVDGIYPNKVELEKVLKSGKKLKLYQGFDPTGIEMHIGHMIGLRKLRQWQDQGHLVIFLIGDGTGQAGDPSGKTRSREKFLSNEELRQNAKDYVLQAGKIVRLEGENPVKILYNGDWLNNLKLADILEIAGHFSYQQLSERDLYQERLKSGQTINFREFLYPLLQAYDSVEMEVDLELGGSDQLFNMLCGRHLIKSMKGKDKFVMTTPLLTDSQGRKIGKTEGNVISLTDKPEELYSKIMSLSDDIIVKGLEYLTDVPTEEIGDIDQKLKSGENPMQFKKRLSFEIVKQLHSDSQAQAAQNSFEKVVQHGEVPLDIPSVQITRSMNILDALIASHLVDSKSEAKRLLEQRGVEFENQTITDPNFVIKENGTIRAGKRKFAKIELVS